MYLFVYLKIGGDSVVALSPGGAFLPKIPRIKQSGSL